MPHAKLGKDLEILAVHKEQCITQAHRQIQFYM